MKSLLLAIATILITASTFAQSTKDTKSGFSLGPELTVPVGNYFNASHSFGLGVSGVGEYKAMKQFSVILSAGYIHYFGKTIGSYNVPDIGQVPVLAGLRFYLIRDIYVSGQAGLSFFNHNYGTSFTFSPGVGLKVSVLDASLRFMAAESNGHSYSNAGVRVGYTF